MLINDLPQITPGPVETLQAQFEEEERKERKKLNNIVDHHYETYLFAMAQMPGPDNSTNPGFENTTEWLLGDRISPKASSLIHDSGWSLHRLLVATDQDLRNIGIAFQRDRQNVLSAVRSFHLAPWRTMQTIKLKPDTSKKNSKEHIVFLLETFSRLVQQLYTDNATIAWLRQRLPKKDEDREHLKKLVKETMDANAALMKLTEEIHRHTKKVNKNLPKHPIDHIEAKDKRAWPFYLKIVKMSMILGSITIILPRIEPRVFPVYLNSFSKLSVKCLLAVWMLF